MIESLNVRPEAVTILNRIFEEVNEHKLNHPSLLGGDAGIELYKVLYNKYFASKKKMDLKPKENVQNFIEDSITNINSTFCHGEAGRNCFFYYLNKRKILSKSDIEFLCDNDDELKKESLNFLEQSNYDFLHGAIGIAHYFLYSKGKKTLDSEYFNIFFNKLSLLFSKSEFGNIPPFYDFEPTTQAITPDKVCLGLAHGIPSILKCCIQCYKLGIAQVKAKELAEITIEFILKYQNRIENSRLSYFPSFVVYNSNSEAKSRLGWCYGDLGIAFILYQSGIIFSNKKLSDFSLRVFEFNSNRRTMEDTSVTDAGLCHGSAGVAHIFNRMYFYTKHKKFYTAKEYWIRETLKHSKFNDTISGYKVYDYQSNTYIQDSSILTGVAGIGLSLISYLTNDFSWDFCLMLND